MDEIRISDTARYPDGTTFTTFGQGGGTMANPTPFTADANTKLLIHSNWDGGLGADSSGNYNTFTPTNLVATDQMIDTPTNNWCTLSPLVKSYSSNPTFSEGNLKSLCTTAEGTWVAGGPGTFGIASGKWYWEWYCNTVTAPNGAMIGIVGTSDAYFWTAVNGAYLGTAQIAWQGINAPDHWVNIDAANVDYSDDTYETGDICGVALDRESGTPTITFYLNGESQGAINLSESSLNNDYFILPSINAVNGVAQVTFNFGQDSSFAGVKTAQGNQDSNEKGDFYYEPPTDHLALCTSNLPSPDIALPGDHFNTVLYAGSASSLAVTGAGFQPEMTWIKARTVDNNNRLFDAVRGASSKLIPDGTHAAEIGDEFTSFDSDGFTLKGDTGANSSGNNFVSWNWKGGGTPTADNDNAAGAVPDLGSVMIDGVASTAALAGASAVVKLSANTTNGFGMGIFVGTGSSTTFAHGLSVAPELLIVKKRNTTNGWAVGSDSAAVDALTILDFTDFLLLDTTDRYADSSVYWDDTAPTPTVFTVNSDGNVNSSGGEYAFWCWHSIEGYSQIGSYWGNGNANGPFISTGFRSAYVLIKKWTDSEGWYIFDNKRVGYNVKNNPLQAQETSSESTATEVLDIVSNGFHPIANHAAVNTNGDAYLYLAFAEAPFKYSNAR